jgi:hypothetical protein
MTVGTPTDSSKAEYKTTRSSQSPLFNCKVSDLVRLDRYLSLVGGSRADWNELLDLFTDDCTLEILDIGVYVGKAGVRKTFKNRKPGQHSPGPMG